MKIDFKDEIIALIGSKFIYYDSVTKNIIQILYRYTKYNQQPVKPALITPDIYFLEFGKLIDPKKFETLGRKLRAICRKLNDDKILFKNEKGAYFFNLNYATDELF